MELIEPERYELFESPRYEFEPNRREFLEALGAGIIVTLIVSPAAQGANLGARLHIAADGTITILTGKVEVGQGARTELAMAAAEELRIPLEKVRVLMADTDLVPVDGITAGSRTTPSTVPAVRKAAAAAREILAKRGADADVAKEELPTGIEVTAVKDWHVLGTPHYRVDGRAIVTGEHRYPSDISRPGMLYGSVLRPPSYGAELAEVDLAPARKIEGVVAVRDGNFAACAAPTSYGARKAVEALAGGAKWETKEQISSGKLFAHLKETSGARQPRVQARGSVEDGLSGAKRKLKAVYQVPFIQHAPMEPRAAVAEWHEGKLTVWTGTQNPHGVRDELSKAFHIATQKVRVIVPDTGGGFGGKHTGDAAIEAARLAREAGKPVSLRWTRAEEFTWAYFRPAGLFEIEAGLDANGLLTAWDFANYNAGTAAIESPYRNANSRTRFFYCDSPLREGSYRGIAATANNFARECFMDELAETAGMDPLDFRLANIDNPRLRDVLAAAAERFRWRERKKGGIGLACGTEKGSYVAACVEVSAGKVAEICMAFECGAILNPANLRMQVEGSIIQGLGGALTEEIQFAGGKLINGSFSKYPVPRFRDVPKIQTILLNRPDLPSAGAGETPIIAVAPAIAAAAFRASGNRPRSLPIEL